MGDHHIHSPSKLDALSQCPCYESDPAGSPAAERGTRQHKYLELLLKGGLENVPPDFLATLEQDDIEAVEWACDWVQENTTGDRMIEEHLTIMDDEFQELTNGTADVLDLSDPETALVIDYKSGQKHAYKAQLAAYGLGAMQRLGVLHACVVILYGRFKSVEKYFVTYNEAMREITRIIDDVTYPDAAPRPCDYCDWCQRAATCSALEPATTAMSRWTGPEAPATIDLNEITDPRAISELLTVCSYAQSQIDAIKKHALTQAKDGAVIPGYQLKERAGAWEIDDLQALYAASLMEPDQFMSACKVVKEQFETALVATGQADTKAAAAKMANKLFGQYGARKASSQYLQKEK